MKKILISAFTLTLLNSFTSYASQTSTEVSPAQQSTLEKKSIEAETHEEVNKNGLGIELLGKAGIWSAQYDRRITDNFGLGIGFGAWTGFSGGGVVSFTAIPMFGNYYFAKGKSSMFGTLGITPAFISYSYTTISTSTTSSGSNTLSAGAPIFNAGFGYEWRGGFLFRIAFAPIFGIGGILPWGGITLGGTF